MIVGWMLIIWRRSVRQNYLVRICGFCVVYAVQPHLACMYRDVVSARAGAVGSDQIPVYVCLLKERREARRLVPEWTAAKCASNK